MMRKSFVVLLVCFLTCFQTTTLSANTQDDTKAAEVHTKASGRVAAAGTVLEEIQAAPDQR
ncbi:MAG: hypothetical protein WBP70_09835, partial [Terriglobales bacterium]